MHTHPNGPAGGGQAAGAIAATWAASAAALAAHFFSLQNRTDVHGRYVPPESRKPGAKSGKPLVAYTAHVVLTLALLIRHFAGRSRGDLVGLHVSSPAETCKWVVVDIDAHGVSDDPDANSRMALGVYLAAKALGLDVMLLDSNGAGGYHLWVVFGRPVPMADAWRLGKWLVRDFASFGLARPPETFPGSRRLTGKRVGNLVRLPGLHHTRNHRTRVWDGARWLEGQAAIEAILAVKGTGLDPAAVIPRDFEPTKKLATDRRPGVTPVLSVNPADRRSDIGLGLAPEPSEQRIATVREALGHLSDEYRDDFDTWLRVGMSLRELGVRGLELWHVWAQSCPKYCADALDEAWAAFAADGADDGGRVTLGSLFYLARQAGWPGPPGLRAKRGVRGTFTTPVRPIDPGKEAHR